MSVTTLKILNKADKLLSSSENWIKGELNNSDSTEDGKPTRFCLMGAVQYANGGKDNRFTKAAENKLLTAIRKEFGPDALGWDVTGVVDFNDEGDRTFEDVKKALAGAKKLARSQTARRTRAALQRSRKQTNG